MTVIQLHPLRSCWNCAHFQTEGHDDFVLATRCGVTAEPLDDERVGATCPDYQLSEESV